MAGLPGVSLQSLTSRGDVLQIAVPFEAPASKQLWFWAALASSADTECIGWLKFERRTVLNASSVFEATELRPASADAPAPLLSPLVSVQLRLGEA